MAEAPVQSSQAIKRQIKLPMSKAVEIAWKNIRLRLSRSLIVTSGIVLALAFLISILTNDAIVAGMREWAVNVSKNESIAHDTKLAAQNLQSLMQQKGVPTSPQEIKDNQIRTRWLLGLALLVAFVGILNATIMSVTERFREIGTMKCLGALDGFIVKLFLIESLFQGIAGTVIGVTLGLMLSLLNASIGYGKYAWVNLPMQQMLSAVVVCFFVGILLTVFGAIYPAWQAARMQPIEAMRVEA